jgi:putative oxidoreductase
MIPASRSSIAWVVLRLALAGLIAAHGWARLLAGAVEPFGVWLVSQGIPLGPVIAWTVTGIEILGAVLFAAGRLVLPLSVVFASIYAVGIVMVHAKSGWFVVGLGRNGAEYSVLLIIALLCVGAQHVPSKSHAT